MDGAMSVQPKPRITLPGSQWTWLIERPHRWRRQLWIKGRRMRAAQLVERMTANGWSAKEAARQFELPVAAVHEAQRYVEANHELLDAEAIEEQRIENAIASDIQRAALESGAMTARQSAGAAHLALAKAVRGWLLTLEQEHEAARNQDPNELISDRTCHVCAGIDELWTALKAAEAEK